MTKLSNSNIMNHYSADDIICIEAESSYSTIHFIEKKVFTSKTLKHWENTISDHSMIRVHKSFTINKLFVKSLLRNPCLIEMINGKTIPISRSHKKYVLNLLSKIS